ncbi:unnamed protein product [Lepeophtheirus salmonis]|uniref:(salmon louse) hypothetical protein n=1 Tax=Lepeophtheirus salmonis TaxID=72036 RepID=A0A7R8CNZ6_LEPSM|nr:unnamed protein product [Lepeophtheirus salmonis]CAF2880541.1 unnamed protein product [Lepeophtheirus salmonis]
MSLAEQEAEVLTQEPALTSGEITDLLLCTNEYMTREQIQIIRLSPTYKDMVVNPSGSSSRAVINTSNSSVFVPDSEVANPNVFEPPLREADTVSLSQATVAVPKNPNGEVFLFKDKSPPPIPPKSRNFNTNNNATNQQPIETIVLDYSEGAEAVEGPMDIVTSPTPVGPLQADTAPVEGDKTPQRLLQSPTPQECSSVLYSTGPPDPEDLKLLEDTASGVDLDSFIPELLAVVAASMTSGKNKKGAVLEDQPGPTVTAATVNPSKKERLIISFTLKHQRGLTKLNDSPLSQTTCIKIVDLFEDLCQKQSNSTIKKPTKEGEESAGIQIRLQVKG